MKDLEYLRIKIIFVNLCIGELSLMHFLFENIYKYFPNF